MELLVPAGAAALVALPVILALYVLKVRGPRVAVASLALWPAHLADRQANVPWKRLRPSWLLVAQLLVAAAVALALMRPGLVGAAGTAGTTVVLIDGSASMRATDVSPSRFEAAVSRARRMAGRLGPGQEMAVVVLGAHAQLLASPTSDPATLRAALDRAQPSGEAANLEEGVSVANAVLSGRRGGSVLLLGDGHTRPPSSPPALAAPLRYQRIGTSADNVAISSLDRTPAGDVLLRVANLGTSARDLRVEMRADGRLVDHVPLRVEGGSAAEATWPRLPQGTAFVEARLTPADDFALDDAAWLLTGAPPARRVLVVTEGEGFLTRALGLRDDLELVVVKPGEYKPGPYDLHVFDGFVPEGALPSPALVVNPPEGKGPVPAGPQGDPGGVLPGDPREPLLAYVSLRDVHVQSAAAASPPPDWRTVIAGANGPLLLVHQGEPRLAQLTFDVHRSDLPLRAAFPILVQNLVAHLVPGGPADQVLPLGRPARLSAGPGASAMEVTTPGGRRVRLRPPFPATLDDTARPGVYTVETSQPGSGQATITRFVVALTDPSLSRIAPGDAPQVRATAASTGDAPEATLEVWPWLAGALFVLLVLEWVVFLRG